MECRVFENFQKKYFEIPKKPKSVPKSIQTCFGAIFEHVLGQSFRKIFAQFSTAGRIVENFQKNQKKFQNSKNAQNGSQKNPKIVIWDNFSEKILPSFPWKVESSKFFKKIKKFSKFQKRPKSFPKVSKRVLNKFWGKLFENFFSHFSMEGRVFENFHKNQKKFQNSKNAQNGSQKNPNVF